MRALRRSQVSVAATASVAAAWGAATSRLPRLAVDAHHIRPYCPRRVWLWAGARARYAASALDGGAADRGHAWSLIPGRSGAEHGGSLEMGCSTESTRQPVLVAWVPEGATQEITARGNGLRGRAG